MKQTLLHTLALVGGLLIGGAGSAEALELRFGHAQPTSDTVHLAAEHFKKAVEDGTNGEINVTIHPGGALGGNRQMVEGVRLGTLDLTANGNPFWTAFAPRMNVLDLPYLFEDYDHVYRVLDGPVGRQLLEELEQHRVKGLAFWEIGFRSVTNSQRSIQTPSDLEGLKIRVTPNKAHVRAFQLLGANPVSMSFTEVYMALQTGAVDAQENPVTLIYTNRFNEVQKHLTLTRHAYTAQVFGMNLARFNSLSPEQQEIVVQAARSAAEFQRQRNRALEGDYLEKLKEAGMQIVDDVDTAPFREIVMETVKGDFVDEHGPELVEAVLQAR